MPHSPSDNELMSEIKNVISALLCTQTEAKASLFEANKNTTQVQQAVEFLKELELDSFHYLFEQPFLDFISSVVEQVYPNQPKVLFLVTNYEFVSSQFRHWIERIEGGACSADKTRYLLDCLLNYWIHGQTIEFDWTAQYTFHFCTKTFTNQIDVLDFFDAIYSLYYGSPDNYLKQCTRLIQSSSAT